ncbi:DUF2293 domain-containing protein [Mariniblastus sp.]|nr:DUF2293 domain-containing protein [Mariniblastus sp.]
MPHINRIVRPAAEDRVVFTQDGQKLSVPKSWSLLKPGDAGATRRVKAAGPSWTVKTKKGRRTISLGVWADRSTIDSVTEQLNQERATPAYRKKMASAAKRREKAQEEYIDHFTDAVFAFLNFHESYRDLAGDIAVAVAKHATPVGSGTVARTKMIPIEKRAEAAVIAWMRHQTTAYDNMVIPRVKGKRREVRRLLAEKSRLLLEVYRNGRNVDPSKCLLHQVLKTES